MDELVKRLRNCAYEAAPCNSCASDGDPDCVDKMMHEAADAIEELLQKVQQLPRWIPVTERLPETDDEVVVAFKNSKDGEWWYRIDNFVDGEFCYNAAFNRHIEYWMPLPEPEEEGSDR